MNVEAQTETTVAIAEAVLRLSIARGAGVVDDITGDVYVRGLLDLRADLVTSACDELGLEPRGEFKPAMPSLADIRGRVEALARDESAREASAKLLPAPVSEADEKPYFCLECRDEPFAWRSFWCRGIGQHASTTGPKDANLSSMLCARRGPHVSHTYVEKCGCASVNPVSAEHRRRMNEAKAKRETKRR